MEKWITLLGVGHIASGIMTLTGIISIAMWVVDLDTLFHRGNQSLLGQILFGIIIFLALLAIPQIIGGIGILKYRPWARTLLFIVGIVKLPHFPIDTILGIYTVIVLMNRRVIAMLTPESAVPERLPSAVVGESPGATVRVPGQ